VIFPLGGMTKEEVREHAARFDLRVAEKAESQDICFVPDGDYVRFLEEERGAGKLDGEIVHVSGKVLGRHRGTYRYTIGQRRGLGIAWSEPLFVTGIVGEKSYLHRDRFKVRDCSWHIAPPVEPLQAACRIRYRHQEVPAQIHALPDNRAEVVFSQPQQGITPGQAAVFYDGDRVLGGGWIE
jgi:tRNA-specific 2-thiouridylase